MCRSDTAAEKLKDKTDEVQRLSVGISDAEDKAARKIKILKRKYRPEQKENGDRK
ncbi:MAG: hypothetical protein ACLR56_01485 [Oscillospiraceae bacterium]